MTASLAPPSYRPQVSEAEDTECALEEQTDMLHQRRSRPEVGIKIVVKGDVFGGLVSADMLAHETLADDIPLEKVARSR